MPDGTIDISKAPPLERGEIDISKAPPLESVESKKKSSVSEGVSHGVSPSATSGVKPSGSEVPSTSPETLQPVGGLEYQFQKTGQVGKTEFPETVEDAKKAGKKPTFTNYINSATKGTGEYVGTHLTQTAKGVREAGTGLKEGGFEGALDLIKGSANAVFGAASFTPVGAAFNVGTEALVPESVQKWIFSPASQLADKLGYKPKEGELGEKVLSTADILASLFAMHKVGVGAKKIIGEGEVAPTAEDINQAGTDALVEKLKSQQPLNTQEAQQVKNLIDNTTPDDLKKAFDENKDLHPQHHFENKVVNVVEKSKEDKGISNDIAKLDVPKETFDNVVQTAQDGGHLPKEKADELKQTFEDIQKAKEVIPEEHRNNPKVITLVAEKNDLIKAKEKTDKVFHAPFDEKIETIDNKIKQTIGLPTEDVTKGEKVASPKTEKVVSTMGTEPLSEGISTDKSLRTWELGDLKGTKQDAKAVEDLNDKIVNHPDDKPANPDNKGVASESFNEFSEGRVVPFTRNLLETAKDNSVVVTHNSVFGLIKQLKEDYIDKGEPIPDKLPKEFRERYTQKDSSPGDSFTIKTKDGKEIHVVRHGETEDNAGVKTKEGVFRTDDTPLTEDGKQHIKNVADKFKGQGIEPSQIITSDLPRAVETAKGIHSEIGQKVSKTGETKPTPLKPESKVLSEAHPKEHIETANKIIDSGLFNAMGEKNESRPDFGLSKEEVDRGIRNIKDNENTQAARTLIEKINEAKAKGEIPMIKGVGGNTERTESIPFAEQEKLSPPPVKAEPKSEEPQEPGKTYSTKKEKVEEGARELGLSNQLSEATKTAKRDFGTVWDEAKLDIESGKTNSATLRNNLADGKGIPDGMSYDTANAILLHDQIDLENVRDKATEAINKGGLSEDEINDLQVEREQATQELYKNYIATRKIGTELGRGLNVRKMLADKEYSLTNIQSEMMAQQDGKPLSDEQKLWTEQMAKDIAEKAKKWDDFQEGRGGKEAITAIQDYIKKEGLVKKPIVRRGKALMAEGLDDLASALGITKSAIGDVKPAVTKALAKIGRGLIDEGLATAENVLQKVKEYIEDKFKGKVDFDQYQESIQKELDKHIIPTTDGKIKIPHSLIKELVAGGIDNIEDLTKAVKEKIKESYPDVTDREIRDAITGYGKLINMSKDDINISIRKMKRIGKLISGLEDVENKKRPLRSGLQRDKLDAEERAMKKELQEAMKELPMDEEETARHFKTALDATKNRLKNKIEDLQKEIDERKKINKSAKRVELDDEAKKLVEHRDELQKQHDEIFKDEAFKQKQRLEAYKQRSVKKIAELENRLEKGDFSTKAKPSPIELDKAALKIQSDLQEAKDKYQEGKEALRLSQRNWSQKGVEGFLRVYREGLLSRVTTLGKLAMFGLTNQLVIRPIKNLAGTALRIIPKINEIAKQAPTEGGMNLSALAENYKTFVDPEAYKQAYKKLGKLGKSDLDRVYGEHQFNYGELPFITTKSHGAIKHVPLQAEMNYAKKAMSDWMIKNAKGDVNNPAVQDFINKYAYAKGMDAIYMGESKLLRQYQMNIRMWEKQGGNKYALAKVAKFFFPIIKVPYNFTKDVMIKHTPIGIADASYKAFKADIEKLTPQEADAIMTGFKKGLVGTSMILLGGYLAQKNLGGLYSKEDKAKGRILKPGEVSIGGVEIPHWATHNALVEVAQMGATVSNVFHDAPESNGTTPQIMEAMTKSVFEAGVAESGNLPFYGELKNINEAVGTWEKTKTVAGQKVASIVPGIIQEIANKLDTRDEEGKRQTGYHPLSETRKVETKGFVNPIKAVIPLVRNTMDRPDTEIKKSEKHGKPMSEPKKERLRDKIKKKFEKAKAQVAQQ